jgi:hypothetical protein
LCPLSEETQPVNPVPVSLAGAGLAQTRPASISHGEKQPIDTHAPGTLVDTQPVKTQPVRTAPVQQPVPSEPELGRLIYAYRPLPGNRAIKWAWGLGGFAAGTAALSHGVYLAFVTYERFGPVPALSISVPWIFLGKLTLLAWISIGIIRWASTQPGVRLYANGLFLEGRRKQSLTWDQIDGIAHGVTGRDRIRPGDMRYFASLFPNTGRPVHLHGTGDGKRGMPYLPELVSRIKANLYPGLQVELARMFREGLPLRFGPLNIDQQGIRLRRRRPIPGMLSVPWDHVERITVESGYFLVKSSNRHIPYRVPVSKIPNLEILLKIIDQGVRK